jgi:hypothetical protein
MLYHIERQIVTEIWKDLQGTAVQVGWTVDAAQSSRGIEPLVSMLRETQVSYKKNCPIVQALC